MISNIINKMSKFNGLYMLITNIKERKNKRLMIDKILSYSPDICEGIDMYNDANRNFWLLIILGGILKDFLMISLPCCILAVFFIVKMIQFIKYKTIYSMTKELAKDLLFKGIYNKNKAEHMLREFADKYGEDEQFYEFYTMLEKYEQLVIKIEYILKNINKEEDTIKENDYNNNRKKSKDKLNVTEVIDGNSKYDKDEKKEINYKFNKGSRSELGNINKAIELFDNKDDNKGKAILLKNRREEDKNLKVYLYKKSIDCEKNIL